MSRWNQLGLKPFSPGRFKIVLWGLSIFFIFSSIANSDDVIRYYSSQSLPLIMRESHQLGDPSVLPQRDRADLLGERVAVGTTWYDYQSNGTLTKLIAVDDDGGVHIVWTNGLNNDWAGGERHTFYNYVVDGEPQFDDGVAVDNLPRGGFCNIAFGPIWGAVPFFHATVDGVVWTHFAIDEELGRGEFTVVRPPRVEDGNEYIWPRGAVDRQGRVHIIARMRNDPGTPVNLEYVRAVFSEDNEEWQFTQPRNVRPMKGLAYAVVASPVSDKVAIIFPAPAYPEGENARWNGAVNEPAANNNLFVYESPNGEDFPWNQPINATRVLRPDPNANRNSPFYQGDTLRPYMFVDGCYDYDDNLHIVFSSVVLWEQVDPNANPGYVGGRYDEKRNFIWHWDRESDEISLVASGRYDTDGTVGPWRQNISFPSLGVDEDNRLYCVFTMYPARGDRAANGHVSGEIYATVSVDGGKTWAIPVNLTDTHSQNAQAGECQSESWSSLAARVTDQLHIAYILDRDAGGVPQNEGVPTQNPVMYHWVDKDNIPTEPRILGRDFHVGYPAQIAYEPNEINLIAVPQEGPARGEVIIRNTNQNGLGLHFTIIASQEIAEVVRFDPPAQRVEPGGEVSVGVIFAPDEVGVVEGEIVVYHTGSNVNSPIRISFTGIGTPGFGSITGVVTDLEEERPVPGAVITLQPGEYITQTGDDGRYSFEQIPAFEYRLTCSHPDFLDYVTRVTVEPEGLSRADIALRFATFELDRPRWEVFVDQNEEIDLHFSATNRGNGPVRFRSDLLFPGGDIEPWDVRWTLAVGDSTRDSRIVAATFVNDRFYIAGGNSGAEINYIYVFGREGNFIQRFEQPARSPWGMRDLAWDGRLIWGGDGRILYGIDLEGNLVASINTPLNPVRAVAWDPTDSLFWICDLRSPIYGINVEGREIVRFNQPDTTRINGLAWWEEDPEGYPLYAFSSNENIGHPRQLYKINPQQRRFAPGVDLEAPEDARAGGIEFSEEWDPYNVVLIAILQMPRDGLAVYQVAPRTSWVTLEPREGEIPPQESQEFTLTLNTMRMPEEAQFEVTISFNHTGRGHQVQLPITLNVTAEGGITQRELALSVGWNLISLNIEPAESHMAQIFASLIERGILILIKDDRGNFTSARQGWQFPEWNPAKGYWVKLREAERVSVMGRGIPFDQPIPLREGWQAISYYPRTPSDVRVALSGLEENLIVVKNGRGQFYLPAYNFSNMPPMREGEGYLIKTVGEGELVYRLGGRVVMSNPPEPSHFTLGSLPEISNMSLLILHLPPQIIEIGVRSVRGKLVGVGVADDLRRVGVAVWGGDSGWAQEGEPLLISAWDGRREYPLTLHYIEGEPTWTAEGVSVAEAVQSIPPDDFALLEVFPNPFNHQAVITFSSTSFQNVNLNLYDLNGRVVKVVYQGYITNGMSKIIMDAGDLPTGLYLLQMLSQEEIRVKKVMIMK